MSDHLPECPVERCCARDERATMDLCICERLRACEQRVFQEQIKGRQHDMVMAYLRGLDAARDAVAALSCFGAAERGHNEAALAAIDALRGES